MAAINALLPLFRSRFAEFEQVLDPYISGYLDAAALEVDVNIWGPKANEGIIYLAAHKMALSPFGMAAKLVSKDGSSTYWSNYHRLARQVTIGVNRVT